MTAVIEATENQRLSFMRQADWFDPADHPHAQATLLGVGGIGSPTAWALAKLGIGKLTLIDPDNVERQNVPNQMYGPSDVGDPKVHSMHGYLSDHPTEVEAYVSRITDEGWEGEPVPDLRGIVIAGPDNMQARSDLWHQAVKMNLHVPLLLDARMGGQNILLYAVNPLDPDDIAYYESKLYSDEEARDAPCTAAAVIDVGFLIASLITRAVRKHYAGEPVERMMYVDQSRFIIGKEELDG